MREFSNFVLEKLREEVIRSYSLIELDFKQELLRIASTPYPITYNGNEYLADIGVIDFRVPIQTSNVDRQSFSISFADNNSVFKNLVSNSESGRDARLYMGFFDEFGVPNTDPENVIIVYEGFIDAHSYSNDFSEAIFSIELSSPMADLSLVNTLVTSPDGMDQISETDTSFDNVLEDNEQILKWGKV